MTPIKLFINEVVLGCKVTKSYKVTKIAGNCISKLVDVPGIISFGHKLDNYLDLCKNQT